MDFRLLESATRETDSPVSSQACTSHEAVCEARVLPLVRIHAVGGTVCAKRDRLSMEVTGGAVGGAVVVVPHSRAECLQAVPATPVDSRHVEIPVAAGDDDVRRSVPRAPTVRVKEDVLDGCATAPAHHRVQRTRAHRSVDVLLGIGRGHYGRSVATVELDEQTAGEIVRHVAGEKWPAFNWRRHPDVDRPSDREVVARKPKDVLATPPDLRRESPEADSWRGARVTGLVRTLRV